MKRILTAICVALAAVASFSCTKQGADADKDTISVKESNLNIPAEGGEATIVFNAAASFDVTVDKDWCKSSVSENVITFTADANDSFTARYARAVVAAGGKKLYFTIQQYGVKSESFMKVDENWTVRYGGVKDYQGENAAYIYNDVADPTLSGKYIVYYTTKEDFTKSGLSMDDFALELSDEIVEDIKSVIAYYAQKGVTLSFGDFLSEESDYGVFDPFDAGDYIGFAIGFTEEGVATGHYAYTAFNVASNPGGGETPSEGYEAWLGEWTLKRGSETDTWTISTQENGTSYTIKGIEGTEYPVTATYEQGYLVIRAQDGIGTATSQKYGECTIGLFGGWGNDGNFASGTYVICAGTISGNTATLTPGSVSFQDGTSQDLDQMFLLATTSGGQYLSFSEYVTTLPVTLTKKSGGDNPGGGDTPKPGTGSEAYNKWIGNWSVDSGAFTLTLSEHEADKTFSMKGWQMTPLDFFEDYPASFDAETGNITLYGSDSEPFATKVDIGADEGVCSLYFVGKFLFTDGKEYYITNGGESGYYDVATGAFQTDGSIKFTGNSFELQKGGEFTFCRLEIIAIPESDPDGGAYFFQSKPNQFPLTAVQAAGQSSVKALGMQANKGTWVKSDIRTISLPKKGTAISGHRCTPHAALSEAPVATKIRIK